MRSRPPAQGPRASTPTATPSNWMPASVRRTGASPISRPSASTSRSGAMRAQLRRSGSRHRPIACIFTSPSARRSRTASCYAESFEHYREGNRLRRTQIHYDARAHRRSRRALQGVLHAAASSRARAGCGAPARRSDLHRRPAARGLDADRADPGEPLAGRGHDGAAGHARARAARSALRARADKPSYPQALQSLTHAQLRELGEEYLARTRIQRKTRPPVLHRQDAEQLPARRPHPSDAAQRADHRRAPPSARLLFLGVQAALRARPELHLRPGGARPLLPRLRRADGALRQRAARARPPRDLRGHGARTPSARCAACSTTAACRSRPSACASTRTSAPCAPRARSRCASPSIATASTSGVTSSRGSVRSRRALGPVLESYPQVPDFESQLATCQLTRQPSLSNHTGRDHAAQPFTQAGKIGGGSPRQASVNHVPGHAPSADRRGDHGGAAARLCGRCPEHRRQDTGGALQEVVVTAEKRAENLQDVPVSITALATEKLEQLNVQNFDDYVKYLPSVAYPDRRPGLRARSTCAASPAATTPTTPARCRASACTSTSSRSRPSRDRSTSTSMTSSASRRSPDRRAHCTARARSPARSASSPTSPIPPRFKAGYDLTGNTVRGQGGYVAEGFVNIPLSPSAAVRLVGWAEHDGGYIDNLPSTITYPSDGCLSNFSPPSPGCEVSPVQAKRRFNPTETYGGRGALKLNLGDNWTIMPTFMGQSTRADGTAFVDPSIPGDLSVQRFYPDYISDQWWQAALTVQGHLSNFDVTYAGGYMSRHDHTPADYSDYSLLYDRYTTYISYAEGVVGHEFNPSQHIDGTRPVPQDEPRAAHHDPEGVQAALRGRPLLRAPGALHPAELPGRRTADLQFGDRLAAVLVADESDPRRPGLGGVRRAELRFHVQADGNGGLPFLPLPQLARRLLRVRPEQSARLEHRRERHGRQPRCGLRAAGHPRRPVHRPVQLGGEGRLDSEVQSHLQVRPTTPWCTRPSPRASVPAV